MVNNNAEDVNSWVAKSWFVTYNNPAEHGDDFENPQALCEFILERFIGDSLTRSGGVAYCISAGGLHHLHMVFEDTKAMRFKALQKLFPSAHFEVTRGSKQDAEDYLLKRGRFEEKGEKVVTYIIRGDIKGGRGKRRDLDSISELIDRGMTPDEILAENPVFYMQSDIISKMYFDRRWKNTPVVRNMIVYWHVGESGSGKSYTYNKLVNKCGLKKICFVSQYSNGFLDDYQGEPILFLDEFRAAGIKYSELLSMLDVYKTHIHARYHNVPTLWTEVHITSILPPENIYKSMVGIHERDMDTFEQLKRRLSHVIYHWKDSFGYHEFSLPASEYTSYELLKQMAIGIDGFIPFDDLQNSIFGE